MNVTATPAPKSSVLLEIELPPERFDQAITVAVRHLSQRTRIAGFRPGKAPRAVIERQLGAEAVVDEAMEHLVADAYRAAVREQAIVPLADPSIEVVQAEAGKPVIFKATVAGPAGDPARRLQELQLHARDRGDRRGQDRQGHRRAA